MCSVWSESSLPPSDRYVRPPRNLCSEICGFFQSSALACSASPPLWHDQIPNSESSPRRSASTPNASSSPRGGVTGRSGGLGLHRDMDSTDLPLLLLGNGSLERSLLEAVEGLESLNLGGGQKGPPPVLPEKRRGGESRGRLSHSSSLSGFSSPHSSSSLSLPFSPPMTPDSLRGVPSPGAGRRSREHARCIALECLWSHHV